jgi:hypothetical protein
MSREVPAVDMTDLEIAFAQAAGVFRVDCKGLGFADAEWLREHRELWARAMREAA